MLEKFLVTVHAILSCLLIGFPAQRRPSAVAGSKAVGNPLKGFVRQLSLLPSIPLPRSLRDFTPCFHALVLRHVSVIGPWRNRLLM
jgi:hypothetical protein